MDLYAEDLYAQYECFPFSDDEYSGPERIFAFTHPGEATPSPRPPSP